MESNIYSSLSEDRDLRDLFLAAFGVVMFMVLFIYENKVYDLSTAAIFAFSLGFLARGKLGNFYLLYPVGCLNRETMFLLSIFFSVYSFFRLDPARYLFGLGYQGSIFLAIRIMLVRFFEANPGNVYLFWPGVIAQDYLKRPMEMILLIMCCAVVGYLIARNWNRTPAFLQCAFLTMFPLLVVMHLTMGMAFELRVFAEIFPVAWILPFNHNLGVCPKSRKENEQSSIRT